MEIEEFDKRIKQFWNDIDGIINLLNNNTDKVIIKNYDSKIITDYLLWRILNELKILNTKNTLNDLNTLNDTSTR